MCPPPSSDPNHSSLKTNQPRLPPLPVNLLPQVWLIPQLWLCFDRADHLGFSKRVGGRQHWIMCPVGNHRPLNLRRREEGPHYFQMRKQLDHFYNSWVRPQLRPGEALSVWSAPYAGGFFFFFFSGLLSAGPACSLEAEVWAGNVNKPLWSIKDLWGFSASLCFICRWAVGKVAGWGTKWSGGSATVWWRLLYFSRCFLLQLSEQTAAYRGEGVVSLLL